MPNINDHLEAAGMDLEDFMAFKARQRLDQIIKEVEDMSPGLPDAIVGGALRNLRQLADIKAQKARTTFSPPKD